MDGHTSEGVNFYDALTGIGTIALAFVTVLALGVTVWLARRERSAAVTEADHARMVDMLIALGKAFGMQDLHREGDLGRQAKSEIRLYLSALPEDCAVLLRYAYRFTGTYETRLSRHRYDIIRESYPDVGLPADPEHSWVDQESSVIQTRIYDELAINIRYFHRA